MWKDYEQKKKDAVIRKIKDRAKERNLDLGAMRLATELELLRIENNLSQPELAEKAGIHVNTYKKLIGSTIPPGRPEVKTLMKLSRFFKKEPKYFSNILNPCGESFDSLFWISECLEMTYDIEKIDDSVTLLNVEKTIINTALKDDISHYIHVIGTEGELDKNSLSVSPGIIESIERPRLHWFVKQNFSNAFSIGEEVVLHLKYSVLYRDDPRDSATSYVTYNYKSPSRLVIIKIIFPLSRPCLSCQVKKTTPSIEDVLEEEIAPTKREEDGRMQIVWRKERPDYRGEYTIYWKW